MSLAYLDFLELAFTPDPAIVRDDDVFDVRMPWSIASFGERQLAAGWWKFECEGDVGELELRLTSSMGDYIVFSGANAGEFCVRFGQDLSCDVSLVLTPWPSSRRFRRLCLRRLSICEELAFLARGASRMLSRQRTPAQIFRTLARIASGHPVGVRKSLAPSTEQTLHARVDTIHHPPGKRVEIVQSAVLASILDTDILHPRAFEIVAAFFEVHRETKVIYADALEGGRITAKPCWDAELAGYADYVQAPIFVRANDGDASWSRICAEGVSGGARAVQRIALPLVSRSRAASYSLPQPPIPTLDAAPSVSIIVPTKFRIDLLAKCFAGLAERTAYPNFEVILMDNGSTDVRLDALVSAAPFPLQRVVDDSPFNFSYLNNRAVEQAQGDIILLLNDDVEPIQSGWLSRIVSSAMRSDVGAVGARLLYPDRSIQHAGVMLGLGGVCGHLWKGKSEEEANLIPHIVYPGSRMAVTAACLAVRRDLYRSCGGLDESYAVAFNDIDFCLRLHMMGLRTIYRGDAVLIHHESQSRGLDELSKKKRRRLARESRQFLSRWKHMLGDDPFGSPAIDRSSQSGDVYPGLQTSWRRDHS